MRLKPLEHPALTAAKQSTHPLANCQPRYDNVVVRRDQLAAVTEGGIVLPDSLLGVRQSTGVIIKVGPLCKDLQPGREVIMTGYAALEINDNAFGAADSEYVLLKDADILAFKSTEK